MAIFNSYVCIPEGILITASCISHELSHSIPWYHQNTRVSATFQGYFWLIFPFNIQIYHQHHGHIPINIPIISHQHTTNYTTPMVIPMIFPPSCHRIEFQFQHETTKLLPLYCYSSLVSYAFHEITGNSREITSLSCWKTIIILLVI